MNTKARLPVHSPYLQTLFESRNDRESKYDYTVLRAVVSIGRDPKTVDFVIIWDEARDMRVIEVAERLFITGLLRHVRFLSASQGNLSVYAYVDDKVVFKERLKARRICKKVGGDPLDPAVGDTWEPTVYRTNSLGIYRPRRYESQSLGVMLNGIACQHHLGLQRLVAEPRRASAMAR
jgi:hypothetical protein